MYRRWESNPHALTGTWFWVRLGYHYNTSAYLVELTGFEPVLNEPKSFVLPLHHSSIPILLQHKCDKPTINIITVIWLIMQKRCPLYTLMFFNSWQRFVTLLNRIDSITLKSVSSVVMVEKHLLISILICIYKNICWFFANKFFQTIFFNCCKFCIYREDICIINLKIFMLLNMWMQSHKLWKILSFQQFL